MYEQYKTAPKILAPDESFGAGEPVQDVDHRPWRR